MNERSRRTSEQASRQEVKRGGRVNNNKTPSQRDSKLKGKFSLKKLSLKKKLVLSVALVVVLLFFCTFGFKIIRLKIENKNLKQTETDLKQEKSELTEELKKINDKDYIEDQAREKLRMLNRDEILFIFKE